jgi:hypothetical protein
VEIVDPAKVALSPESERERAAQEKRSRELAEAYPKLLDRPENLEFERNAEGFTVIVRSGASGALAPPAGYDARNWLMRAAVPSEFSSGKKWPPFIACPCARGAH